MVRAFLSRRLSNEHRDYRKLLKSIQERYNSYFKGKRPFSPRANGGSSGGTQVNGENGVVLSQENCGIPNCIIKFESYLYVKVILKIKKILYYLH
jgi:hypothetical protein